uniref:Protein FAM180B n=1 Tax=Pelusios castaneus TaxID=367368 RepID=A0A8C8VET4_9SAUR
MKKVVCTSVEHKEVPYRKRERPRTSGSKLGKEGREQFFWQGLEIEANKTIRLQDEELASLRPAKHLIQVFQQQVPKTPGGIMQQLKHLSEADAPLSLVEFDQLLLTSVYCAYQIRSIQGLDKNLWINFFSQLVDEILHDLCKGFCPANSTHLASGPWKEKPFYLTPFPSKNS